MLFGIGSDVSKCISFESNMLFITVIFPNGVNGLVCHLRMSVLIFCNTLAKLISVTSCNTKLIL